MASLSEELSGIVSGMEQALNSGNDADFDSLARQMEAAVSQAWQELSSEINALLSGFSSQLAELESSIQSALP